MIRLFFIFSVIIFVYAKNETLTEVTETLTSPKVVTSPKSQDSPKVKVSPKLKDSSGNKRSSKSKDSSDEKSSSSSSDSSHKKSSSTSSDSSELRSLSDLKDSPEVVTDPPKVEDSPEVEDLAAEVLVKEYVPVEKQILDFVEEIKKKELKGINYKRKFNRLMNITLSLNRFYDHVERLMQQEKFRTFKPFVGLPEIRKLVPDIEALYSSKKKYEKRVKKILPVLQKMLNFQDKLFFELVLRDMRKDEHDELFLRTLQMHDRIVNRLTYLNYM